MPVGRALGLAAVTELRQAIAAYTDQGNKLYVPFYQGLLAEIEAEVAGAEGALARIDEALGLAQQTGLISIRFWDWRGDHLQESPFIHRK